MTDDDDAFLRTIVDNPGHDLPRLVYADWLDDRNDPRGPFLRAEVEWAQPWKEGKRPDNATELRAMAAGLDPLWVARVSRPPLGVCCEVTTFTGHGSALSTDDIAECERNLAVRFPVEYIAFMLNFNGGKLRLPPTSHSFGGTWRLSPLSKVRRWELRQSDLLSGDVFPDLPPLLEPVTEWLSRFVIIGHDPDVIGGIFLGVSGVDAGRVRILDTSVVIELGVRIHSVRRPNADNFASFIVNLREPH